MKLIDYLWLSGLPVFPIGFALAVFVKKYINNLENVLSLSGKMLPDKMFYAIGFLPWLALLATNAVRYYKGVRQFDPFAEKDPVKVSKAKKIAMSPAVPKNLIRRRPEIGTIGQLGRNRFLTIPFNAYNVMHSLVIGGPGSKKTSTIGTSLLSIFNKENTEMVIFGTDIKPEIARRFTRWDAVHAVNFAEVNESYFGWDMYYGLNEKSSADTVLKRMRMIADCLIVNADKDDKGSYFYENARNILSAYLFGCFRFLNLDFIDSIRKLTMNDLEQNIQQLISLNTKDPASVKLKELLSIYSGKESEGFEDIKTTLTTSLYCFSFDSVRFALKENPRKASPIDLTSEEAKSVFLCVPDGDLQTFAPLFTCCIEMVLRHLLDYPEEKRADSVVKPIWLLLDEVGNLPKIPSLERGCALLRSRRVFIWMIIQSIKQLEHKYGRDVTAALIEDCENILVLSAKDEDTCRLIREWCGQYREPKLSSSDSSKNGYINAVTHSDSEEFRYIYEATDIRRLRSENAALVFTDGSWFRCTKFTYRDSKELLGRSAQWIKENDEVIKKGIRWEVKHDEASISKKE